MSTVDTHKMNYTQAPCCTCNGCWHKVGEGYHSRCEFHAVQLEPLKPSKPIEKVVKKFNSQMRKSTIEILELMQSIPDEVFDNIVSPPSEPKKLSEKLYEAHSGGSGVFKHEIYQVRKEWEAVAKCAVEEFEKVIDGVVVVGEATKRDIKYALRRML